MFSSPVLRSGEHFPAFPEGVAGPVGVFGFEHDPTQELLPQLAGHCHANWINQPYKPAPDAPASAVQCSVLRTLGVVDAIQPARDSYSHLLVDGGSKPVFDIRLGYTGDLLDSGLEVPYLTVFGGQRLRCPADDKQGVLEDHAKQIYGEVGKWGRAWLERELEKDSSPSAGWSRSFATEHEIAILALLQRFGTELEHVYTGPASNRPSAVRSIPVPRTRFEHFRLGDREIRVLNARAVIRELRGHKMPESDARPTGRSCFYEWLGHVKPGHEASVLLVTHNPSIYRTWYDMLLARDASGRTDLQLEGAGAAVEPERSLPYMLAALGRLFIAFDNQASGANAVDPVLEQLELA